MKRALPSLFSRLISAQSSPTADIYLAWSCADMLAAGTLVRLAPTVFLANQTLIVFRHDAHLKDYPKFEKLIYVIDDDWRAGIADRTVPAEYRVKLLVEAEAAKRIEPLADLIVVSSQHLLDLYSKLYPGTCTKLLHPAWPTVKPALCEVDKGKSFDAAILGTRSHMHSVLMLIPVLSEILSERDNFHVYFSSEIRLSRALLKHPRVKVTETSSWEDYQCWMARKSFDLGLYPLLDSEFNAARSANKLLEYDQFGAAIVASRNWKEGKTAADQGRCLLVNNSQEDWKAAILQSIDTPSKIEKVARRNRRFIAAADYLGIQRKFWASVLQ